MPEPTFNSYLMLSAVLLSVGLAGVFLRPTPVGKLLSVQVMLGGIALASTAGDRYFGQADGQIVSVVVIATTLAQVALSLVVIACRARHGAGGHGERHP